MTVRERARWAARHGLVRAVLHRRARAGNLDARVMIDPAVQDPYPLYDRLRARGPVTRGALALTSTHHRTCTALLRSEDVGVPGASIDRLPAPARVVLRLVGPPPAPGPVDPPSLLAVDPPDHTRYRRLVSRAFTARAVQPLRDRVTAIADELLDGLADDLRAGPVDLVERYAALLPVTVISELLGVPAAMRGRFLEWGAAASLSLDPGLTWEQARRAQAATLALRDWMDGHVERLRRDPRDDLLSALVSAGDEISRDELLAIAMLVLAAGFETTVNLLGTGAVLLLRHPDQLDALRADPALWPNAVEEVLRVDSPVQRAVRIVHRDTVVAGTPLASGAVVVAAIGGANRDPAVFADPSRFDVARPNARDHLSFSAGPHYCVGAALARVEGEIGLRRLLERFPDLALGGPLRRRPNRVLRGYSSIPVTALVNG